MTTAHTKPTTVAIIGAGPGGIAMGIQLAQGGYDFTIFDSGDGFGGTWRKNTYPGAACDVPSHFYSYSFALNPRWSKTFAEQPEILGYLEQVAADHGLAENFVPHTRITTLRWSDTDQRWTLRSDDGQAREFDIVVSAVGMLDVPYVPDIPGAERFRGRAYHSSNWDHAKPTAGERVASIGTGASAIQYVPAIAADTAHLTVFQRTPIWVSPRYDEPFTAEQQELFERDPVEARKVRDAAYQDYESANFAADSAMTIELTNMAYSYLTRKVKDPELRAKLTPSYPVGCKRPLQSRAWFPTFALPNVTLETSPIVEFTERGLRTADGTEHEVDTVIYGTGFRAADFLGSLDVYGRDGRRLRHDWRDGAEAYLGTVVPGYPNLFTLYGPNTNGVTSIIYILEAQCEFVRRVLDEMGHRRLQAVDIKRPIHDAYNAEIQDAMTGTVWLANCTNYFRHPNGKVVTQFPYQGHTFVERLAQVQLHEFNCQPPMFTSYSADGVRIVADRLGDPAAPAVVFLHGGGQTRRSWSRAAAAVAAKGWQAVTVDLRGHGESDWSEEGDYRVTSFADDVAQVLRQLPPGPVLVGASLGGFTSMLLAGEVSPAIAKAVVLVDIVPNMEQSGALRVHDFMADRVASGFGSLDEVADMIGEYNPHRPRPTDLDGLRTNLRRRGDRWYWHWDPKFISDTASSPPIEVTDVDRMHAAVQTILANGVPMLLVRGQMSDLVSQQRADEFLARFPQVEFVDVHGAGHMVAGDRNDIFAGAVLDFLARHGGSSMSTSASSVRDSPARDGE